MQKKGNKVTDKKSTVIGGLFWTFGERITAQLVTTVVTIILARLLDPEHYGIISIVTVFISLCNIFVTSGFGSAVVQKKEAKDIDFNTSFVISFTISCILYLLLFLTAPFIAKFYQMPELDLVIKVMGIRIIIASLNTIQHAYIQRQMKFKKFFFSTLFGTIVSAVFGILFAYLKFGVWALVIQYLTNTTIDTIVLYFVCDWKVKFEFDKKRAKELFSFGWKVLCTDLIYTLEGDIRSLIVGRVFGSADLAYYDQGRKYPNLLVGNINSSITKVMLPTFSREQDNKESLKKILRTSIRIGTYVLAPLLIGFGLVANNFILLLLTDKWLPAVPYVQVFCLTMLTRPLETACHQALLSLGKSGTVMKIMFNINVVALITVIIATFGFKSVFLIAIGSLVSAFVSIGCFMYETSKNINYSFKEQLKDILPALGLSFAMGVAVYFIGKLQLPILVLLILQVLIGAIIYIFLSAKFQVESYVYLMQKLKKLFLKKHNNEAI